MSNVAATRKPQFEQARTEALRTSVHAAKPAWTIQVTANGKPPASDRMKAREQEVRLALNCSY